MKNIIRIFVLLLLFVSCERVLETQKCSDNPLEEIAVLKKLIANEEAQTPGTSNGLEIIQYTYQNKVVYFVDDCVNNCADSLALVYDCDENVICEFGGIAGVNTCPDFEAEATDRVILFSTRDDITKCDKSVIIDKKLFESAKSSLVEKATINGDCLHITFSLLVTQDPVKDVDLIDSGAVLESFPIQRNIKFTVKENLTKPATTSATTSFDLSSLVSPGETVILNLENFDKPISYTRSKECKKCELTQGEEREVLNKMLAELKEISESVVCENATEWDFTAVGSKACGGPNGFIAYSTKIDVKDFLAKVAKYTKAEDDFNKKWGVVSTCDVLVPPSTIVCNDGKAILVF
ncbi:DUF6970 domain-containing protein [Aquimarina agarilytica]|uniref:DUF6970 domain-containing protein n=1 Tax=Aquimarina agarilytica TaxID=1087449 RepID=UPI00028991B9|nr:hypothetical protein [Aquimarina agarilytica]